MIRRRRSGVTRLGALSIAITLFIAFLTPLHMHAAAISPAFRDLWAKTDSDPSAVPVWGPQAFSEELNERYAEAPGGYRLVQYFDKGRMELGTDGMTVTAGLLAVEMIQGKVQIGDAKTEFLVTADKIAVAGDPDNTFPSYASLRRLTTLPPLTDGFYTRTYLPNQTFGTRPAANGDPLAAYAITDITTGRSIPKAFADFRNDPRHALATIGLAITEPVWATVKVGGQPKDVLVQAFERRVLTYTPTNPDPYKVEFGNIGQHYYRWRYSPAGATPIVSGIAADFRGAYGTNLNPDLGRPLVPNSAPPDQFAIVQMEHGYMLWIASTKKIYTLGFPQTAVGIYDDTWTDDQDPGGKPGPSANQFEPAHGFGKVWRDNPAVKEALGYAEKMEVGFSGRMQVYERGFILTSDSGWTATGNGVNGYWMVNTASTRQWYRPFGPSPI
jgi:hypothetical protein